MAVPSLDDIKDYNPWMNGGKFEVPDFKRAQYTEIFGIVKKKKYIVSITGLRRIGKTIMLKQMGNELKGGQNERFFFSFEEDRYANYESLKSVVEQFLRWGEKPFIFLDEIGRIEGWAGLAKKYHDLGKAHFVFSGSASLDITKGKESLAGRLMDYLLPTWSYGEYLGLKGLAPESYATGDFEKEYLRWDHKYEDELLQYLAKGSFPELINEQDEKFIKKYIRTTTVDRIIYEDIPKTFPIKNPRLLDDILGYICSNTGSITHASNLGSSFGASKDTIKDYMHYLRNAYLIDFLPIEGSSLKSFRKSKKAYAASPSIAYAVMADYNEPQLVENIVFKKLRESGRKLNFFSDSHGHEVDFTGDYIVESKWKSKVEKNDLKSLYYYMGLKKAKTAFVVGKNFDIIREEDKTIYVVPLALFLLLKL